MVNCKVEVRQRHKEKKNTSRTGNPEKRRVPARKLARVDPGVPQRLHHAAAGGLDGIHELSRDLAAPGVDYRPRVPNHGVRVGPLVLLDLARRGEPQKLLHRRNARAQAQEGEDFGSYCGGVGGEVFIPHLFLTKEKKKSLKPMNVQMAVFQCPEVA